MLNHFSFLIFPSSYNLVILLHLLFTLGNTSEFFLTIMARIGTYVGFTQFIFRISVRKSHWKASNCHLFSRRCDWMSINDERKLPKSFGRSFGVRTKSNTSVICLWQIIASIGLQLINKERLIQFWMPRDCISWLFLC